MEHVYKLLLARGYPTQGVDWLRQHRLAVITIMALGAWALFIFIGAVVWFSLT